MDNKKGLGEQFLLPKKTHHKLHGNIMKWVWKCIREEDKQKTIDYVISKSKKSKIRRQNI